VPDADLQFDPEPTTPGTAWAVYRAVLPAGDLREFIGRVQLLEETGLSIISDVDDTLKHSNVPNRRDLFHNTFSREFAPIPGMPELYRECAARGAAFHYVSGSPWQLYEPLAEFWSSQGYPFGSFHLKRFRLRETARKLRAMSPQKAHKLAAIEPILNAFPQRSFVLIGDSGEQDPEIYARLLAERPEQIRHVFIRAVRGLATDTPRIAATFGDCPRARWTLYDSPESMAGPLLQLVDAAAKSETPH
jgi:phosphatidate phosphatase APP1